MKDRSGVDCIGGIKTIVGKWVVVRSIDFLAITFTIRGSGGMMIIVGNVIVVIVDVQVRREFIGCFSAGSSKRMIVVGRSYHFVVHHPFVS
jgi:hypothetical protein